MNFVYSGRGDTVIRLLVNLFDFLLKCVVHCNHDKFSEILVVGVFIDYYCLTV